MSSSHSHDHSHAAHGGGHHDSHASGGHATVKLYWVFCVILCLITGAEWFVFKVRESWGISAKVMVPALLIMSLVKFVMVVGWYMHLRYDHNWLKYIFAFSLCLGGSIAVSLCYLM